MERIRSGELKGLKVRTPLGLVWMVELDLPPAVVLPEPPLGAAPSADGGDSTVREPTLTSGPIDARLTAQRPLDAPQPDAAGTPGRTDGEPRQAAESAATAS